MRHDIARRFRAIVTAALAAASALGARASETVRVDVDALGAPTAGVAPRLSADGRFVTYVSFGNNIVPGDTNNALDAFLLDRSTGAVSRVSVNSSGVQGNGDTERSQISADGRWVALLSTSSNFSAGDSNNGLDVFVHDRVTGATVQASVSSAETAANFISFTMDLSANGSFVVFSSEATNLVPGDTNVTADIFLRDLANGTTSRVSVDSSGGQSNGQSLRMAVSGDGRFVAFESVATNLVAGDTNGLADVFVRDTTFGATSLSVTPGGAPADAESRDPEVSDDGRFVAFASPSGQIVAGDGNGDWDVFVRDLSTGTTQLVSVGSSGDPGNGASRRPTLSADGRFVVFDSTATDLVAGDTNGESDLFLRDLVTGVTERVSVDTFGREADRNSNEPSITPDGRYVAFWGYIMTLYPGAVSGVPSSYVRDRVGGCADGTVSDGAGGTMDVLFVNGETRLAELAVHEPIEVDLASAALGPAPAGYAIWVWRSPSLNPRPLFVDGTSLGCTVNPSPLVAAPAPQAFRCLIGGLDPAFRGAVKAFVASPASAPWTRRKPGGFAAPATFTIQGVIQDAGSPHPSGLAVTNGVTLRIQ